MADLIIDDVPDATLALLSFKASLAGVSLDTYLRRVLEAAAEPDDVQDAPTR